MSELTLRNDRTGSVMQARHIHGDDDVFVATLTDGAASACALDVDQAAELSAYLDRFVADARANRSSQPVGAGYGRSPACVGRDAATGEPCSRHMVM